MKRTVKLKNLIAFAAVLILLFSVATIPAHATWNPTSKNRFGAWLGSALLALNITLQSTVAPIEQMYEYIADPVAQTVEYTYPATSWEDDIMNRAVVKIAPDVVSIDGVEYTDIWLSNSAAEKFRVNAFDFQTAYNIASQSEGTFASGEGVVEGIPVYIVSGSNLPQSQKYTFNSLGDYAVGNWQFQNAPYDATHYSYKYMMPGQQSYTTLYNNLNSTLPSGFRIRNVSFTNNRYNWSYLNNGTTWRPMSNDVYTQNMQYNPFDFDYVSETIPVDQQLPSDYGINIRVPSDTPGLQNFITNNIDFTFDNGKYIDFSMDPDVKVELDDLIDIIAPILVDLDFGDVTFNTIPDTPQPQPQPEPAPDVDPDTPINEITYNDYYQTITNQTEYINNTVQNINNNLTEINENVTEVNDNLENIENYTRNIWDDTAHIDAGVTYISQDTTVMVENQDTIIDNQETIIQNQDQVLSNHDTIISNQDQIIQNQDQIIENQDTIIQESIPEIIENIPKIDEICNNIDTAPYHDLDTGITHLPSFFLPFITDLRSALGIWHYVTEWLAQISTTFAFITGCLVGTSIMTPIYAAIAGFMCIKIYRRMTA